MMKRLKRIGSLVLAIVLTLSMAMPYMGTVFASNASDDLTGWEKSTSSTITGNPTDGWKLSLAGSGLTAADNTCYSSSYKVSDIRVLMDLSTMTDGQEFWLSFGYSKYGLASWDGAKVLFALTRKGNQLEIYGHNGSAEIGKKTFDFDFSKTHVFEFLKDDDGKWQLAIDNIIYPMGVENNKSVDYFVNYMNGTLGANTKVGFISRKPTACVINNVKIGDKTLTTDDNDVTNWTLGGSSTVAGNPTDGWKLSLAGSSLTSADNTCYSSGLKVSETRVLMDLSTMQDGQEFWLSFGYSRYGLSSWNGARVFFVLTRRGNQLEIYGHNNAAELGKTTVDFNFGKTHVFEFLKDANDKWQLAIDSVIYPMGNTDETSVDYFVNYMDKYLGKCTHVGFISRKSTACVINNVKVGDKTLTPDNNDVTGWTPGESSTVTGNPTDGWKLSLAGSSLDAKDNTCYQTNYKISDLRVSMDLSTMTDGQEIWLSFGNDRYGLAAWDGDNILFRLKRIGNQMQIYGHNYEAELGNKTFDFDFTQTHVFEFVKDANAKWQLAIDGTIYPMGDTDATSVDYFVNNMDNTLGANAKVGIIRRKSTTCIINNINFSKKAASTDDLTGWEKGDNSTITGTPANGWTVSMTGNIFTGSNYGNYYTANLGVSELQMTFDLSELLTGKNVWLVVSNAKGAPGAWSDTKASFILKKIDDTTLEFGGHTGGAAVGTTARISNFDFAAVHKLTFEKKGQVWYPAIDGTRYDIDCTEFVNGMTEKSPETTVFGFGPQSDDALIIKNIKFSEKPFDPNNHTGWVLGTTSTVTGDDTNGWNLSVKDSLFNASSNNSYYITEIDASKLQISMDLSELCVNKNLWIFFGDEMHSYGAWNETSIGLIIKKMSDGTTLELCAHSGSEQWGTVRIPNFDFTKQHTFEFAKVEGVWQPVLDGVAYPIDKVDAFVEGMMTASSDRIVIGFGPQNGTEEVHTIKNLKFEEKGYTEIDWSCGSALVTGDRESGYNLHGAAFATHRYLYKFKPQDTTLSFKLNKEEAQTNVIVLSEDISMGLLPEAEEMKNAKGMVLIIEQKNGETYLQYWDAGHKDKVLFLAKYKDFDFDATHTIAFKNENGNWYLVLDGNVLRSYQLNDIVENMLTAEDGVYYRFSGWSNAYTFENVKFAHTPTDSSATSNWNVVGYEMSGTGDKLSFKGDGYASWKKAIDLTKTSLEAQFKPANGGWVSITVGDTPTVGATILPGLVVPEGEDNAISFIFGRQNETDLRLSLYGTNKEGKKAEYLITLMKNFDFDATHEIRFVEKDGSYYIAIDGQILQWPNHDGDNKYITNALTSCLKSVEGEAYIRLLNDQAYGAEWGNPTFVEEPFTETDLFVDGDVTVSQNKNGLSAVGIGTMGINKVFDIKKDKLSVQFDTVEGNWIALTIGDTASPMVNFFVGIGNEHNIMTILLARQKNNVLRISLLDQGQEKMFMALSHFDFDKTHTFSFVEHRGKYYLAIDDRMIEAVVADGDDEVVTTWVTKCVKALSKSGAYIRFVSPYDTMEISNVSWKGMGTIRGIKEGTITGKSPKTGDFTPVQPIVYAMVLSTSAVAAVGVQKYRKRRKEK